MNHHLCRSPSRSPHGWRRGDSWRRGNTLLITMLVITGLVAIVSLATDRMTANSSLTQVTLDRGRASLAAESVAALIEGKLLGCAAEVERLKTNVEDNPTYWWNLDGCWHSDAAHHVVPAERGLWLNGCLVRWRIEPVAVTAEMPDQRGLNTSVFSVNREPDPNLVAQRAADARQGANSGELLAGNPPYFHYRIVTEAYAMKDPNEVLAKPWDSPGRHTCAVQVQRVVQLKLVNLFAHVVFYAANGETGDLELDPDSDTRINGSLHSNGSVFMGGAGDAYKASKGRNYKKAADDGGLITLGNATDKVDVTGVMGVFRLRKVVDFQFAADYSAPSVIFPKDIPKPNKKVKGKQQLQLVGTLDINGGNGNADLGSEKVSINGVKLTFDSDSRADWSIPENQLDPNIRDAQNGGQLISTLANIPELAAYPLEPQHLVGNNVALYRKDGSDEYTINPKKFPSHRLFYTSSWTETTTPTAGAENIYATDLPLFRFIDAAGQPYEDVWPVQPQPTDGSTLAPGTRSWPILNEPSGSAPPDASHTYLGAVQPGDGTPAPGYYLAKSLYGDSGAQTGLTIRERGRQNTAFRWAHTGQAPADATGIPSAASPVRADHADAGEHVRAYVAWLKSQYVVYLGKSASGVPIDITGEFFDYGASTAEAAGDPSLLVASADHFMDRRAAHWLRDNNYYDSTAAASAYRADVLTLHVARVLAFIKGPRALGAPFHTVFNGLIYVHRTPRLGQVAGEDAFQPLAPWLYHPLYAINPLAPSTISNHPVRYLQRGTCGPTTGTTTGTPNTWMTCPSNLAVRLDQGDVIDWGGVRSDGGPRGVTIITPNQGYVQGSFNSTTVGRAKAPSCAIFADAITVLSNRWRDADNQALAYDGTLPKADACRYDVSLVLNNLPTDFDNVDDLGSGGVQHLVRFLEDWNGRSFDFSGSLVVLNRMRYSRSKLGLDTFFTMPKATLEYDSDLLSEAAQPPFAPIGVTMTRVIHTLNVLGH